MKDFLARKGDLIREIKTCGKSFRVKHKKAILGSIFDLPPKMLKTENASLIAANEELLVARSKTDEAEAALTEIKEDLDESKKEKTEIQEKLNTERKKNSDLQSEIEQCRSNDEILRDEIKEEKARCSRITQDLKNDLEQRKNETEMLKEQLSNHEKKNSRSPARKRKLLWTRCDFSENQDPGWYSSEYKFKISTISGCEIIELDAKLRFGYSTESSVVTVADQQSAIICFSNDEAWKQCEEFDGRDVSLKPATKYPHWNSCQYTLTPASVFTTDILSWEVDTKRNIEKTGIIPRH
ncbi:Oidioi.mRNA.OKI2018_I69.chr1.g1045.t1.cds [Oikopleura dioica]|uniref:Oidioi.mRNA.OKI2018_I69.chr1.g1045.t1.cds n=1 Tax=Oikopleura dioica TaxID=34765 RepID=A0ABN7SLQ9_OIKDI|nr:Oidioi.mRNA.OKI2018_I69.chr1.g1045.t1.cds [Oikopleura dioica]